MILGVGDLIAHCSPEEATKAYKGIIHGDLEWFPSPQKKPIVFRGFTGTNAPVYVAFIAMTQIGLSEGMHWPKNMALDVPQLTDSNRTHRRKSSISKLLKPLVKCTGQGHCLPRLEAGQCCWVTRDVLFVRSKWSTWNIQRLTLWHCYFLEIKHGKLNLRAWFRYYLFVFKILTCFKYV